MNWNLVWLKLAIDPGCFIISVFQFPSSLNKSINMSYTACPACTPLGLLMPSTPIEYSVGRRNTDWLSYFPHDFALAVSQTRPTVLSTRVFQLPFIHYVSNLTFEPSGPLSLCRNQVSNELTLWDIIIACMTARLSM